MHSVLCTGSHCAMGKICNDKVPSSCVAWNSASDPLECLHKCAYPLAVILLLTGTAIYRLIKEVVNIIVCVSKITLAITEKSNVVKFLLQFCVKSLEVVKQILIYDLENWSNFSSAKKGQETRVHLSSAFKMAHCLNQEKFNLEWSLGHSLGELFLSVWKGLQETVRPDDISVFPFLRPLCFWGRTPH